MKNGTRGVIAQSIHEFVYNEIFQKGLLLHLDRSSSALVLHKGKIYGFEEFSESFGSNLRSGIPRSSELYAYDTDHLLATIFQFYLNYGESAELLTYDFTTSVDEIYGYNPKNTVEFIECLRAGLGQPSAFAVATRGGFLSVGLATIACNTGRQVLRSLVSGAAVKSAFGRTGCRVAENHQAIGAEIQEYISLDWELLAVIEGGAICSVRVDHIGRPVFATNAGGAKGVHRRASGRLPGPAPGRAGAATRHDKRRCRSGRGPLYWVCPGQPGLWR